MSATGPRVDTQLLVIGAGPYALSVAAHAAELGITTITVGRSMAFWRENMPEGMFLRSGADWHLDAGNVHTFQAFLDERRIVATDVDPIPIGLFLEYADWFTLAKGVDVEQDLVVELAKPDRRFQATLATGKTVIADAVVCAPGVRHYTSLPDWAASIPEGRGAHTCDLVQFGDFAGARVLIVGGRQSAYEWAALIHEHGAERIDIVHRHDVPRFDRVSWKFVDEHVEHTINVPGYWRGLPSAQQEAIAERFWEVGRLTLEYWLTPRLSWDGVHRRPGAEVAEVAVADNGAALKVRLTNSERLTVDRVVFATGYRADLRRVPYLARMSERLEITDGFPVLNESFETTLPGLYITGFSATRDFGPFFGFVKGCPASATLIARALTLR